MSFWLRPAGFSGEQVGGRCSSARTRCWVGIANLFGGGGPTRGAVPPTGDIRGSRRARSCVLTVRIRAGVTRGAAFNEVNARGGRIGDRLLSNGHCHDREGLFIGARARSLLLIVASLGDGLPR